MAHGRTYLASLIFAVLSGLALAPGCSVDQGTGCVVGTLDISDCWAGPFDLRPNFFAAVPAPSSGSLLIRIQNGSDYESFSDGIAFAIEDIGVIRGDPLADGTPQPSLLCACAPTSSQCPGACPQCPRPLVVGLAPSVRPPGFPIQATPHPSIVHATLYLQRTCRTQNLALYAMDAVTLNADGSCSPPEGGTIPGTCGTPAVTSAGAATATDAAVSVDGASDATAASADAAPLAPPPASIVGTSTITFHNLFDGNPNEPNAHERLSYADFDLYFADPRDVCAGAPPPRCRGHLTGSFNFYFERGRPAQPFP